MKFLATNIQEARDTNGVESGKAKYEFYFIKWSKLYGKYKDATNLILIANGYEDCIVDGQ